MRDLRFKKVFKAFNISNDPLAYEFEHQYMDSIPNYINVVDGTVDILQYLSPKYTLHIITNGFMEVSKRKLEHSKLTPFFKTVTYADEVNVLKPDPKIFDLAMKKANAKIDQSIFIGDDWIADAIGSKNYGMKSIFFDRLNEDYKEDGILNITCLSELKNYL